ncbi:AAA family ATPase, partial [Natrarchaeobius sp. A-rgal3]|uniref:AAA family ATPase n=1 Tax=Natrarchaeobius versutus TaxID=1679078 RepID=UPI00351006DA
MSYLPLQEVILEDYRSINQGKISLSDTSILIGKNNSGKSNVIKSLSSLKDVGGYKNKGKITDEWFARNVRGKDRSNEISIETIYDLPEEERNSIEAPRRSSRKYPNIHKLYDNGDCFNKVKYRVKILNSGTTRKAVEKSYFTDIDSDWVP